MAVPRIGCLVLACALSGCANVNSIYRNLDLTGPGTGPEGVALDIKQRAILTNPRAVTRPGEQPLHVVCAEPSPDALSAYVASLGATGLPLPTPAATAAAQNPLNLAVAAGETSGSVGLRTQSIQLLRDLLFANCLTYMNGGTNDEQYYALQRRSQNITLGLLAIEQLTGAVKADQVGLNTSSTAATGADNTDKETDSLKTARAELNQAQKGRDTAEQELKVAKGKTIEQQKKVGDARKGAAAAKVELDKANADSSATAEAKTAAAEKKSAADEKVKAELEQLQSLEEAEGQAQVGLAAGRREVTTAESFVTTAERTLADAQRRVRASSSGTAQFAGAGPTGGRGRISEAVAKEVSQIVRTVLEFSSSNEDCSTLVAAAIKLEVNEKLPAPAWYALQSCIKGPGERERLASALNLQGADRKAFVEGKPPTPAK